MTLPFHYRWFVPWYGSTAPVIGSGMEQKTSFHVISLISGDGDQTHLYLTLATTAIVALVIFAIAFIVGLFCGRRWGRQQMRLEAAANLKRRARA